METESIVNNSILLLAFLNIHLLKTFCHLNIKVIFQMWLLISLIFHEKI